MTFQNIGIRQDAKLPNTRFGNVSYNSYGDYYSDESNDHEESMNEYEESRKHKTSISEEDDFIFSDINSDYNSYYYD